MFFSIIGLSIIFLPAAVLYANSKIPFEWQQYLTDQLKVLKKEIADNPEVIQKIAEANQENARLTQDQIMKIDKKWRETEGVDLFIVSLITNELAERLKESQKTHKNLVEIFMTDQRGNLIAATNKTTDFYQADEEWWQKTFQSQNPNGWWGEVEFDQSSFTEAVPLYLPIFNQNHVKRIGVLKAILSKKHIPQAES